MGKDIRLLLVFLIIALALLVYLQNQQCVAIPNSGSVNTQHFTSTVPQKQDSVMDTNYLNSRRRALSLKEDQVDKTRSSRESQKVTSRIIDNILKNEKTATSNEQELDRLIQSDDITNDNSMYNKSFENPMIEDVNSESNSMNSDNEALDELIREVNTGNDLILDNPKDNLYRQKSKSINSAKKYRKVTYANSDYRVDFNGDNASNKNNESELNSLYEDALIFNNNKNSTNDNYKGYSDVNNNSWGNANIADFKLDNPQTQQEKVLSLYNSNDYLPNNKLTDKKLEKGFQILENPVSVNNPNLIPVLKSIPVSSVIGSKRNSTYDIRSEPPCPKTVVAPFLNSSIMPDVYATQRGCL